MRAIIQRHNHKLIHGKPTNSPEAGCNCRKLPCPLNGNCLAECLVYEASVSHNGKKTRYYGSTGTQFKTRYRNHTASFRNTNKQHDTTLATFIWENGLNPDPQVEWKIVGKRHPVAPNGICGVCTLEKVVIMKNSGPDTLNMRNEISRRCPHRDKNSLERC